MAKLIRFNPEQAKKQDLRKAGRKKLSAEDLGQLNLFEAPKSRMARIRDFSNPFVEAWYLDGKDNPKAIKKYEEAIRQGIFAADAHCNLAILYTKQGDVLQAIQSLSRAVAINPAHAEAHYNLGNLYFDKGDIDLAMFHYEIARDTDPDFPEVYFNLALACLVKKDRKKAIHLLNIFKELAPEQSTDAEAILRKI